MRKIFATLSLLAVSSPQVFAAGGGDGKLPLYANKILPFITDSVISVWISVLIIVLFVRLTTKKMEMVPSGFQNFGEWVIESIYSFFEGILGEHLVKRTFWFFGGTFLLILVTNWLALIPGVGTIGLVGAGKDGGDLYFLRGGNADINMTMAMAFTFALLWFYWAITENTCKGFLCHIFAPKGQFAGIMKVGMVAIFFLVGILEVVSICIRPVALSFRLFGNIYGGEQTMGKLMGLAPDYLNWLPSLPFYFMEILVGLVQAVVFTLLCAVFLKLICEHDHHEEEGH